ncbi:ABC transporter permease [Paenibacillus darwinianus]|uniref:ABC transporter permease n=1 Tax=Paenibacillus darwinianus TaxID=1380763 RepID=A0A9W5W712_9BACL|nr:carbohydrate ABC transporter permease [Paenibacillus darwinianus]EXX86712.1 ABC transporter permease [Paenibacillus darwinianus]EXX86728.1 ABC transporter permease [Paenibacillus darwinianus]EXX87469.1 ABC transporter permease [Paenibacillus darwinianus]
MSSFQGSKINPATFNRSQIKFYLFLIALAVFMIMPIVFMFSQSLKPINELFLYPPRFFVDNPSLKNFYDLINVTSVTVIPMTRFLFNSIVVTGAVVFLSIVISAMAGFALSKLKFKSKGVIFEANIIALMFVPASVAIPRYLIVDGLGLTDNMLGHIIPLLAMPVGLFLIKQFVDQIPNDLIEAAAMDGAGNFTVFRKVIIPVIMPALATVAILAFQTAWNNTETSEIYMNTETLRTFAFYMTTLTGNLENKVAGQGIAAAAALIMFVPNLIIFVIMQSRVLDTMAHSGLK